MGHKTKKVKSTGRFGARYGRGIKNTVKKIEAKQNAKHTCPKCGTKRIKRKAAGIYYCTKCNAEFAGGAYIPVTMTGSIVKKMVSQKKFLPNLAELISIKEETKEETKEDTKAVKVSSKDTKKIKKEIKKEHKPKKSEKKEKKNVKKKEEKKEEKETDK